MSPDRAADAGRSRPDVTAATIGIVPARAGSERFPGKNRQRIGDLSLVERAIEHGLRYGLDQVVVTTDDPWIEDRCAGYAVTCLRRPAHLATSGATSDDVIHHVLDDVRHHELAIVVLLQPTSPFIDRNVLDQCLAAIERQPVCVAMTVCALPKPAKWLHAVDDRGVLDPIGLGGEVRCPTGAAYAFVADVFRRHRSLGAMTKVGVDVPAHHAIDIDEPYELAIARALYDEGLGDDLIDR